MVSVDESNLSGSLRRRHTPNSWKAGRLVNQACLSGVVATQDGVAPVHGAHASFGDGAWSPPHDGHRRSPKCLIFTVGHDISLPTFATACQTCGADYARTAFRSVIRASPKTSCLMVPALAAPKPAIRLPAPRARSWWPHSVVEAGRTLRLRPRTESGISRGGRAGRRCRGVWRLPCPRSARIGLDQTFRASRRERRDPWSR